MKKENAWIVALLFSGCMLITAFLLGTMWISQKANVQTVEGRIVDTYIKRTGESTDTYHVAIEKTNGEVEVYQNHDAFFWGKFNSANVQQSLISVQESAAVCTFTVTGWRVHFLSWFQNIVEYSCRAS